MSQRTPAPGHCELCGQAVDKSVIVTHLDKCMLQHPLPTGDVRAYLFEIKAMPYWVYVMTRTDAKLADLDEFLRGIWLECCGHESAFTIAGTQYGSPGFADEDDDVPGLEVALEDVLKPKQNFSYDYDFSAATSLELKLIREQKTQQSAAIRLLARNDAPEIECQECAQPARKICNECIWSGEGALCEDCAPEHACGNDALLPVVNSPR
ncbi:MAG: hypothetical protein ACAI44_18985, partial [Candidatus Sericytochromatia bacterium]